MADSWEILYPPWSTKFHKEMGVADLVRRRVWPRSIQRAQRTPSGSGDTEELREASKVSTDTSLQFESEDVNEIEVFENQRWWLGRGWPRHFASGPSGVVRSSGRRRVHAGMDRHENQAYARLFMD